MRDVYRACARARPAPAPAPAPANAEAFGSEEADQILFPDPAESADGRAACRADRPEPDRIRCLLALRYRVDPLAAAIALDLYAQSGSIAGVDVAKDFDGKYRGILHFVPALPTGADRRHLAWVAGAFRDYEAFFRDIAVTSDARFRWRALAVRFFRSVGARTSDASSSFKDARRGADCSAFVRRQPSNGKSRSGTSRPRRAPAPRRTARP